MNNLFSEIFGCYYRVVQEIVNNAPLSEIEIQKIIRENGFAESCFYILPMLQELPFIEKKGDKYYSLLENKIKLPLTNIEKSWLKAISLDERFSLLSKEFDGSLLDGISPLYDQKFFKYYDRYSDGDNFSDISYIRYFHKINKAMDNRNVIKVIYRSPKNDKITIGHYIPLKFEFSSKDNKFRFYSARIRNGCVDDYVCLSMCRILDVRASNENFEGVLDLEKYIEKFEMEEPVIVEVYDKRNAIERFMVEFSSYKKYSEFDRLTNTCKTKIFYRKTEELEILIKLLSFGPVLRVLGPERFLRLFLYRVQKQEELLEGILN